MKSQAVKIADGGTLVIPAQFRRALGIGVRDTVVIEMSGGELHVRPLSAAVRQAQTIVRNFSPDGVDLADQLIEERRAEADRE